MAKSQSIADLLAKELGYKDKKELKETLERRGDGFAGGVKGRLEEGLGFREAFAESTKEQVGGLKETFSKQGLKKLGRKTYRTAFSGDDIFSAYMRGRLRKKEKEELKEKGIEEGTSPTKVGGDSDAFLKVIAKNSMSLPGMARDMNVMRQNVVKLVKLKGGKANLGADAFFLKEDERERALEVQRQKYAGKPTPEEKPKAGEGGGGLIDSIMQMFSGGFLNAIKTLFSPKMLMKVFTKVFLPLTIIATLFSGIMDGFKRYQETGSFVEAVKAALGGMLNFITFGLFGEETITKVFDSISNFFQPIINAISDVFTGIKNFVKSIFGGVAGDVKDETPAKADAVKATMPGADKMPKGPESVTQMAEKSGVPPGAMKDLQGILDSGKAGGFEGMMAKAKEFEKKYPSQAPATETSPTPMSTEGVPLDQAQRNYELNKQLTGEASKMLGMPLAAPEAPTAAPTPSAPAAPAPIPTPEMSDEDKVKQLESNIEANKKRFAKRESDAAKHIASFEKRYSNDPERVKELKDEYAQTLAVEKKEMETANEGFQNQINIIKKSSKASPTPSVSAPTPSTGGGGESGGGSISAGGAPSTGVGGAAASMESAGGPSISGSDVSSVSSDVAEGQRMESSADMGSVVNAPVTNNSSTSQGNAKPPTAETYDSDLAKMLMTT